MPSPHPFSPRLLQFIPVLAAAPLMYEIYSVVGSVLEWTGRQLSPALRQRLKDFLSQFEAGSDVPGSCDGHARSYTEGCRIFLFDVGSWTRLAQQHLDACAGGGLDMSHQAIGHSVLQRAFWSARLRFASWLCDFDEVA